MSNNSLSRRNFLRIAGVTLAASALSCSGLGYAVTRTAEIEIPELAYGKENTMNNRLLITYATRAGSTVEVAAAIGEALSCRGFSVDVKPVKDKPRPDGYQAVIIGSAIRMGKWLPEAVDFIKDNRAALNAMPVALFTVHMLNTGDDEASRMNRLAYLNDVRPLLTEVEEAYFAGKFDFLRLSVLDRFIAKMVGAEDQDLRDWNKIRNWTPAILV